MLEPRGRKIPKWWHPRGRKKRKGVRVQGCCYGGDTSSNGVRKRSGQKICIKKYTQNRGGGKNGLARPGVGGPKKHLPIRDGRKEKGARRVAVRNDRGLGGKKKKHLKPPMKTRFVGAFQPSTSERGWTRAPPTCTQVTRSSHGTEFLGGGQEKRAPVPTRGETSQKGWAHGQ